MEEEEEGQSSLTEAQQDWDSVSFGGCPLDESQPTIQRTIEHWKGFLTALLKNTSLVSLMAGIHVLPVECLALLTDCIRMAHNLKDLTIQYTPHDNDDESSEMSENYRSKIDNILGVVRGNPAIKKLTLRCLGNDPQSIQDFLTGNASLEAFNLRLPENHPHLSKELARCIAAGLKGNKKLKEIGIFVYQGRLDIICSGLCHRGNDSLSCLESLSLWTYQPWTSPKLGPRVLEAIKCCPSLKTLTVQRPDYSWSFPTSQPWLDYVLKNLHHPECAGLEMLRLEHLTLSTNHSQDGDTDTSRAPADWIVPDEQANKTLKEVTLETVRLENESTARLLLNLRGVMRLHVRKLSYLDTRPAEHTISNNEVEDDGKDDGFEMTGTAEQVEGDEHNEEADDQSDCVEEEAEADGNVVENNYIDYWAQLIRQCTDLCSAHFDLDDDMDIGHRSRILESVLKGSRGHRALEELKLQMHEEVKIPGGRLRALLLQLLLETTCLKCLEIDDIGHHEDLAAGLSGGLRGNKSLEKLVFELYNTDDNPDAGHMITILDSLLQNDTLQHLSDGISYDFREVWDNGGYNSLYNGDNSHDICMAFAGVFRVNKSLNHISLPSLDLQQGRMRGLLEGLGHNTTLTSLVMSNCQTDAPGFTLLQQALVDDKTIPLDHIVLPCFSKEHSVGSLSTDMKDFFQSLVRMRHIKTVDFDNSSWTIIDDEDRVNCLKLLLHAAKENKYIQSFGSLEEVGENESCIELFSDIDYYLKLNRFGRHGLDSTNIRLSLWPAILAPMTTKAEDTDALFFFIREYFMRHSYPLRRQGEQKLPLPKRARLLEHASDFGV